MTQRSYVAQQFVDNEIGKALTHSGLPTDSPMRVELEHEAEIAGVRMLSSAPVESRWKTASQTCAATRASRRNPATRQGCEERYEAGYRELRCDS